MSSSTSQNSTYNTYVSPVLNISIGTLSAMMRANKLLFKRLYNDLKNGNTADISVLQQLTSNSSPLNIIVSNLASTPNSMASPLSLTYNGAVALGLVPPEVTQALSNLTNMNLQNVVIDFGYNAQG